MAARALAFALALVGAACSESVVPSHGAPIRLASTTTARIPVHAADWSDILERSRPTISHGSVVRSTPSIALHSLRLHGLDASFGPGLFESGRDVLAALTDNRIAARTFHTPILVATPQGVRYRPRGPFPERATDVDESHESQVLAMLAELGVPLSQTIWVDDRRDALTLRDVLEDTLANVDPARAELEWAAVAIALYLPPRRSWTTKSGATMDFDDLAIALLERSPETQACAGTHLFQALAVILCVDENEPILSADLRGRVRSAVRERVQSAFAHQHADGGIGADWSEPPGAEPIEFSDAVRLLVTGHLVESILLLPSDLQPPAADLARAGGWLRDTLASPAMRADAEVQFCPRTHAAGCVRAMCDECRASDARAYGKPVR